MVFLWFQLYICFSMLFYQFLVFTINLGPGLTQNWGSLSYEKSVDSLHLRLSLQYLQEFGTPWPSLLGYLVPIVAATYHDNLSIISYPSSIEYPQLRAQHEYIIRSNMIQDRWEDPGWTPLAIAAKNNRILAGKAVPFGMATDWQTMETYPWRIHGAAIYGAPWIPSIYPLYVSIYLGKL